MWRAGSLRAGLGANTRSDAGVQERSAPPTIGARSQAEVQQDVQRFAGRFTDRVMQAAEALADPQHPSQTEAVLRRALLYDANALEIATGPVPELNLLDTLVFVSLVRTAFERHWLPEVFGARGEIMLHALTTSSDDAWGLADKFLLPEHIDQLRDQIQAWQASHPGQCRVESVRLADFSELAARPDRGKAGLGLLANVRMASQAADQALLFGERALFWAQRAPALLRLQARLGALELTSDGLGQLGRAEQLMGRSGELLGRIRDLEPLLARAVDMTDGMKQLFAEAESALAKVQTLSAPLMAERPQATGPALTALEELANTCAGISASIQGAVQAAQLGGPSAWFGRAERLVRRFMVYAGLVGILWAFAFWFGYYIVRR